ncbi:MAG: hypothetical protein WKF44_07500 [Rubrobacteraceae bacterium]
MSSWREEWRESNRANWDERVPIHTSGQFYDIEGFKAGDGMSADYLATNVPENPLSYPERS